MSKRKNNTEINTLFSSIWLPVTVYTVIYLNSNRKELIATMFTITDAESPTIKTMVTGVICFELSFC